MRAPTRFALLVAFAGCSVASASAKVCPPTVDVLAVARSRFDLPTGCTARCEMGIDTIRATISCPTLKIDFSSAFDVTLRRALSPSDAGISGRERSRSGELYWGHPTTTPSRACAVLTLGEPGNQYFHELCAPRGPATLTQLLQILRSRRTSTDVAEFRRLCPYCG